MGFLAEYEKLKKSFPRRHNHGWNNQNSEHGDYLHVCKNCYWAFESNFSEDCLYVLGATRCIDCVDCDYCFECELCYQSVDSQNCYNSTYLEGCQNLIDSHFCVFCQSSHDLFGCVGLKHQKFCIFNRQFSKKEYFRKVEKLKKKPVEEILAMLNPLKKGFPKRYFREVNCENCQAGSNIAHSKNCYFCFDVTNCQDSGYLDQGRMITDSFDCAGYKLELCYQCYNTGHAYNCNFLEDCDYLSDCNFCYECFNSHDLFGCAYLAQQKYCILNRQFSKKEYFKKVAEIKKKLGWKVVK